MMVDKVDKFCYPIPLTIDHGRLMSSVNGFLEILGTSKEEIERKSRLGFIQTVNLTHRPGVTGNDRFYMHSGDHHSLMLHGVNEGDFTEFPVELDGTYLRSVIDQIIEFHASAVGSPFSGRMQLVWLNSGGKYPFHKDFHTPHRYHVPLSTNDACLWYFRRRGAEYELHMPADGRVWYLDPVSIEHTVVNNGDSPRLHLLMTTK